MALIIPAYRPGESLVGLIRALRARSASPIIVVDDGSGAEFDPIFRSLPHTERVQVLYHAVHLGRGAALKTGMNHALVQFPDAAGVVTADAGGRFAAEDVVRVAAKLAEDSDALVVGVPAFDQTPVRDRVADRLTRVLTKALAGTPISDPQTGLRAIPAALIPHLLRLPSMGDEFELDMLIASKHQRFRIVREPLRAVAKETSQFHPLFDSMRTSLLLFRFALVSLPTAVIDNVVFVLSLGMTGSIGQAQALGRLVAMAFNLAGVRKFVFRSKQQSTAAIPKYVALVICNGLVSYALIQFLQSYLGIQTILAKLLAESLLFPANFSIAREFIFNTRERAKTPWDKYYASVPATAKLTRRYTTATLIQAIRSYVAPAGDRPLSIIEIGGANSCFVDEILHDVSCRSYDVIDTNQYGLTLLEHRLGHNDVVRLHKRSVLGLTVDEPADLVFSVGLVEHFDPEETRKAVLGHFDAARPGGTVIITFPTPTVLYRVTRGLIELLGMWKFHDERPLLPKEVISVVQERGDVLFRKTLWPLILTQHLIVAKRRAEPRVASTSRVMESRAS